MTKMKTKREHRKLKNCESGNVLISVLIAVALFTALGLPLTQQTRNSGISNLRRICV